MNKDDWLYNDPCTAKKRVTVDYERYYPANGGHVIDVLDWSGWELDEIGAGSQIAVADCDNCGKYVAIVMANGLEDDGDPSPYIPQKDHWNMLNGLKGY
ncbi:MAG: hypothetical protein ACYSUC_11420 [Planctomycetota bacterium]|jgi:hypothetical protein